MYTMYNSTLGVILGRLEFNHKNYNINHNNKLLLIPNRLMRYYGRKLSYYSIHININFKQSSPAKKCAPAFVAIGFCLQFYVEK